MTSKDTRRAQDGTQEKATSLSPYQAARLVNKALEEAGLSKRIPPQMMYNYTTSRVNAGKKPLIAFDLKTGVDRDALAKWTESYVAKQAAKEATPAEETVDAK